MHKNARPLESNLTLLLSNAGVSYTLSRLIVLTFHRKYGHLHTLNALSPGIVVDVFLIQMTNDVMKNGKTLMRKKLTLILK